MTIEIVDCVQGTPEWHQARAGIPTASMFDAVMASGRGGGESKTRRKYMLQLAGEIITGDVAESFTSIHLERGKIMEEEARNFYAFMQDVEPLQVGFIRNGQRGCSPDALIGSDGMVEFKSALPHILGEYILRDGFPPEHKAQTQGGLLVAERDWIDICVYWPKMPRFVKRAYRDAPYIVTMSKAIDEFNDELNDLVEKIRSYRR